MDEESIEVNVVEANRTGVNIIDAVTVKFWEVVFLVVVAEVWVLEEIIEVIISEASIIEAVDLKSVVTEDTKFSELMLEENSVGINVEAFSSAGLLVIIGIEELELGSLLVEVNPTEDSKVSVESIDCAFVVIETVES